jgi:hypothetical protein
MYLRTTTFAPHLKNSLLTASVSHAINSHAINDRQHNIDIDGRLCESDPIREQIIGCTLLARTRTGSGPTA